MGILAGQLRTRTLLALPFATMAAFLMSVLIGSRTEAPWWVLGTLTGLLVLATSWLIFAHTMLAVRYPDGLRSEEYLNRRLEILLNSKGHAGIRSAKRLDEGA